MVPQPSRVVLDVDTGIDDALALLYAAAETRLDLVGVTTVVGNVPVEVAARNSAAVLAVARASQVPVVVGARRTVGGSGHRRGTTNHGSGGLGGVALPSPPEGAVQDHDPLDLVTLLSRASPVVIAACAPLTNVARYLSLAGVEQVVMVGGELAAAPEPEFNAAHDAVSTAQVLSAETALTVYTADVFETIAVPPPLVARLRGSRDAAARLAGELLAVRRRHLLGDAGALVLMARPDLFDVQLKHMALVGDQLVPHPSTDVGREVNVVVAADVSAVIDAFISALDDSVITRPD
ncbi:nucleoside hydrolase [Nocardioides sp. URHA0020]|uniref:nucleoside hydrolase n=1 Tax=Nocardioides sp. URHA0020 TaxID=1380392 RepID=UPI0018CBF7B8|nr:nucleoside hydrolase [Nocardioides sp. URHA0020]